MARELTHVDAAGAARMVDVSAKDVSLRAAVAAGEVRTTGHVLDLLRRDGLPKGDALAVARLAGIMAAKRTPDLVPLCHPIAIHGVTVELTPRDTTIEITATVKTADRTGVEMEALTCVSVAGLALIDMIKAVDPAATINDVRVLRKEGGKTGLWTRDTATTATAAATERETATAAATERETATAAATEREPATAAATEREPAVIFGTGRVIVASTRAAAGAYADRSGPILVDGLRRLGCDVPDPIVVPDGPAVRDALAAALAESVDVIVTSGGTGISPTDHTPEMTRELLDREVPGLAEALRETGPATAALSRGVAGVSGRTLIVNLPGSTGAAKDGLSVLGPVLRHAVEQLRGGDH